MLEHRYGLNPKEDALINFLIDRKIDFTPLFYNSAIPIKELFYFFVIAGTSFYSFNRIPSLFDELESFNVVRIEGTAEKDLQKLRRTIRSESVRIGILIKTSNIKNDSQWEHIKAQGKQFVITSGCRKNISTLSAAQLGEIYDGEIVKLLLKDNNLPDCEELFSQRLFKPERYVPFYFMESDLNGVEKLYFKMSNMFHAYIVTRYRIMQYYSRFVDIEFMRDSMKRVWRLIKLLTHLKDGINKRRKYFSLLYELNQIDVFIMSQLKERIVEI